MKKIILIGFAACYKSTVGKLLADKLNCAFVDTDTEIECICGRTVQQIFEQYGEPYFRQKESNLLRALNTKFLAKFNTVVACGGGSVLSREFDKFARDSIVVSLTATAETVHLRLGDDSRPLFDGLTVDELDSYMQARSPLYAKYAHVVFNTDEKTPEQVAEQVYNWLTSSVGKK